ncbi:MAG: RagB/SusD family nutrient uptake outer membrane protein [Bacteroidales bacterium]
MKFSTYILYAMLGVSIVSCSDFLSEENKSSLSDQYYKTEEGVRDLTDACYTPLRYWFGKEKASNFSESCTDIITRAKGHTNQAVVNYSSGFTADNSELYDLWGYNYQALNFCNEALYRLGQIDMEDGARLAGEVSFLRAMYSWIIAEMWGDTHYTTEPSRGVITTAKLTSVEEIYKQVFIDLDLAIANCPETTEEGGRVTKWAAKAMKARMLLTRGDEEAAADLAKEIIDNGPFSLFNDYASIWNMNNAEGSTNSECIWYVNYTSNLLLDKELGDKVKERGGNNLHLMYGMKYDVESGMTRDVENGRPFNRYMPTRFLLELFDQKNDQRYQGSFKTVWYMNTPEGKGDYINMVDTAIYLVAGNIEDAEYKRVAQKYQLKGIDDLYDANGSPKTARDVTFQLSKFDDPTRPAVATVESARDFFVFRISEMYLIVAEGYMDNDPATALTYMNTLRKNRALDGHEDAMAVAASDLTLDFILDERARELCGEQLRWFDLKRTKKLIERVKAHNTDGAPNINENHYVRPFPQDFLDVIQNKTDFKQKSGYN